MTPTIRHRRLLALTTLVITLCAAPVAGAHDPRHDRDGPVVAPAKDKWAGELMAQIYSLPLAENPFAGNGNPCLTVGHKVIQEIGGHCTIDQGTTFTLGSGSAWSSAEDPFPQTRAKQLALATVQDRENLVAMTVTVDGGHPVEIRTPRFEVFSPQRTVLLPEDNILDNPEENIDIPSQTVTLSAHGWNAAIRNLSVGEHTIVADRLLADGDHDIVPHVLTVVPRHHEGTTDTGTAARTPGSSLGARRRLTARFQRVCSVPPYRPGRSPNGCERQPARAPDDSGGACPELAAVDA